MNERMTASEPEMRGNSFWGCVVVVSEKPEIISLGWGLVILLEQFLLRPDLPSSPKASMLLAIVGCGDRGLQACV